MKCIMIVATHKVTEMPSDRLYLPVHVGHALDPVSMGYQPDDEGDNISAKNRSYCELTALFWAWKNLDADAIGLCHYRRYFQGSAPGPNKHQVLSMREAQDLMLTREVVLGKPRKYVIETIDSHYRNAHPGGDLDALRRALSAQTPEMLTGYDRVFGSRSLSLYNMFLMKREELDRYAPWLFAILAETSERIGDGASRSRYQQRTMGFLGERLLNVWVTAHADRLRRGHLPVVNTEGEPKLKKAMFLVGRKLRRGQP